MDGSTDTNLDMITTTYDELKDGFPLHNIVVTHPDIDHYGGIGSVLDWFSKDANPPEVLLTDRFRDIIGDRKLGTTFAEQYRPVQSFSASAEAQYEHFNVSHRSFTSDLVLYTRTDEQPIDIPNQNGTLKKAKDDHDNESSIITTITTNNDDNTILAYLTGDAFFDTNETAPFLHQKQIIVFQVPHHGSKDNSNFEFYMQIAQNTQYYLISCGHHGKYCFPHKEVFTAIRDATVARRKERATIVLTDGTLLNGEKVSSFRGDKYEPSISYWDPHLRKASNCELINKDFLQFTFSGEGNVVGNPLQNLIQWSIEGYREMTYSYGSKQRLRMHLKAPGNCHLAVVEDTLIVKDYQIADDGRIEGFQFLSRLTTKHCQGNGCTTSIDGHLGLPAPTDPCTWDNRVMMVYGTSDLIFLQLTTGENIIKELNYENVRKTFEVKIISKVSSKKSSLKKAGEYRKIASLLSKAMTTIIFQTILTPTQKIELIEEVKIALKRKTDPNYTQTFHQITEYHQNEGDVVMRLLQLEHEIRQRLLTGGSEYKGNDHTQELQQIETSNPNLLLEQPPQNIITSFDGNQSFSFFKCYKEPWQIVYGTISNNGEVNWSDQHVYNSLQVDTPMTPLNFKLI